MKNKRADKAASEIVSVTLLLAIAIGLFASVQYIVYSYPYDPSPPSLDLIGSINNGVIYIEHQGGERLLLKAEIRILIGDSNLISIIAKDYLDSNASDDDEYWEISEIIAYNPHLELNGIRVETTVIDQETNSIVMNGVIQGGQN